jgi:hypothetical protein
MRSASENRPKITSCEGARRGEERAALAVMLEQMQCYAMQEGSARRLEETCVCRGVGFLDWERNGRAGRETVV